VNRYGRLRALAQMQTLVERRKWLVQFTRLLANGDVWPFEEEIRQEITQSQALGALEWTLFCAEVNKKYHQALGRVVGDWRQQTRARMQVGGKGKSNWSIEYLTEVRRFLEVWSRTIRKIGAHSTKGPRTGGVFAGQLLDHIRAIKDDRLKTGADLIVQAARGYLRDDNGQWQKRYGPCQMILFGDLSRFRTKADRPLREHSPLSHWFCRALPAVVEMQGQIYSIQICSIGAAFSSHYHARTHAPGIRCHAVKREDLEDAVFKEILAQQNQELDISAIKAGDLVPLDGGEMFVSSSGAKIQVVHAHINAAQNLQRRFWTRQGDVFRLPCSKATVNGHARWLPQALGKRVVESLGGYGWLVPTGDKSEACRWQPLTPTEWRRLGRNPWEHHHDGLEDSSLDGEMELASEDLISFFRDPSGMVLSAELWFPADVYWGLVRSQIAKALRFK
jgi:hypothetical protein